MFGSKAITITIKPTAFAGSVVVMRA